MKLRKSADDLGRMARNADLKLRGDKENLLRKFEEASKINEAKLKSARNLQDLVKIQITRTGARQDPLGLNYRKPSANKILS